MTRDEQVAAALRLVKPDREEAEAWTAEIEEALDVIDMEVAAQVSRSRRSKEARRTLAQLRSALKRAQTLKGRLPEIVAAFEFEALDLGPHIEACERLLAEPSGPPRREALKKRLAAREAHSVLRRFGRPASITRGGLWDRLAAIFGGDVGADLYHHLRPLAKRPKPGPR